MMRFFVGILLFIVGLSILLFIVWPAITGSSSTYAVYLDSGDIYFGKLTRFPQFGLEGVYTIQINREDAENPVSIQKFSNVFWGPQDRLLINRDRVVWMTPLHEASGLLKVIRENPNLIPSSSNLSQQLPNRGGTDGLNSSTEE